MATARSTPHGVGRRGAIIICAELLLTGDSIGAGEAHSLGMVSKVFRPDELERNTIDFARRIAPLPTMSALLIKEAREAPPIVSALKDRVRADLDQQVRLSAL
jgi:enoyl-CoA hydratase/carnithine racemase